ncbi:MAG: PP2C family protein-serine/threonine phosphatase [Flavobacteriales bacterium]|nr:PP2C family protein-serine/threonine phosphatase [Flavobacteriales bacterium]
MARLERIVERLELKEFQLRALLDVTKAINSNMERSELLVLYEKIVREELGITRLILFDRDEGWKHILAFGTDGREVEVDVEAAFSDFKDIQVIGPEITGGLGAFDVAVPVYHQERPLAFLLIGDIDEDEQRMSPTVKHLNFIQTLTNLIVVALENKRLARKALQQERERRDLELAAEMQSMLVPRELPYNDQIEVAAWYQPHSQVGGDYYDLVRISNDELALCVADVSGKGFAAALLMSNFQANLRAAITHTADLTQLIHDLNRVVFSNARGERFITLFLGIVDLRTRRLRFVNAGHNPALLHHRGQSTELKDGSIALGMMPMLPFLKIGEVELPADSTLLCYTDGLVEQEDRHGKEFGMARMERILGDLSASGARSVNEALITAFEMHRDGSPFLDDIAVLTARFR